MHIFDKIVDRKSSNCVKYDALGEIFGRDDIIPLWVADTDFISADFIIEGLKKRAEHGVFGYPHRPDNYNRSISGWLYRRSGWQVEEEWLAHSPGVLTGFSLAMRTITQQDDGVLIQQPVYNPFAESIKANNRKVINSPLINTADGYRIDFEDFEAKIKNAKLFVLCNPHNPTGRAFNHDELQRMGEICVKYGVYIIADEIHSDYVYEPNQHIHIAALSPEFAKHTITFVAPSKSFNIAGLATAVAIISSEKLRDRYMQELNRLFLDSNNIFGAIALELAYSQGDEWMDQMKNYIAGNIDFILKFLEVNLPSVRCHKPEATYLLWLDFSKWGMTQNTLNDFLVNKAKLGMNSGAIYGIEGKGFERLNVGAPRSIIKQAMRQLLDAVKTYKPELLELK